MAVTDAVVVLPFSYRCYVYSLLDKGGVDRKLGRLPASHSLPTSISFVSEAQEPEGCLMCYLKGLGMVSVSRLTMIDIFKFLIFLIRSCW